MTLPELQAWLASAEGLGAEIARLRGFAILKALDGAPIEPTEELQAYRPDWRRLLLAGSVLAMSDQVEELELALLIAQAALQWALEPALCDAGGVILSQLANHRALLLGEARGRLAPDLDLRLGVSEQLNQARRELRQTVLLTPRASVDGGVATDRSVTTNPFQFRLWDALKDSHWISATAPTAAGKTFIVLQWLMEGFVTGATSLAVILAPTRALVAEIERELLDMAAAEGLRRLRVGSLPVAPLGDGSRPTILVFTQERLQVFLHAAPEVRVDLVVVDEAHKLGDGARGVILQDAIEQLARHNDQAQFVFLSPLTENPEVLVEDAPAGETTRVVPSQVPTVTQNLILADQAPLTAKRWQLSVRQAGEALPLGVLELHAKPDAVRKRLSYMALALGRKATGTLVYANDAHEAEQIASQIYDGLAADWSNTRAVPQELLDLSDFARDTIHAKFALVEFARRGVAFHYGNMPSLLRFEIERLFRTGQIPFLVCTSTLIEGVNLACQTIIVRGPRKGRSAKMQAHDFWNLAGRAGRWGQDFQGNIICVDPHDTTAWPQGVPRRARYRIARTTETALSDVAALVAFLANRPAQREAIDADLEQVAAYLLAWRVREGRIETCPVVARLDAAARVDLIGAVEAAIAPIRVPREIILRHVGVSAFGLQALLDYFEARTDPVEELLPPSPESLDAQALMVRIFTRIHQHMFPAFVPLGRVAVQALTTINWMRGYPLARMISERIAWLARRGSSTTPATAIRDTMKDVEEVARFKAPKYLSAYVDVLRHHLGQLGRQDLLDERIDLELYLEFGVGTRTMLSMIGIGLSRTSAVELNAWLGDDELDEAAVLNRLLTRAWDGLSIPNVVKREIAEVLVRQAAFAA